MPIQPTDDVIIYVSPSESHLLKPTKVFRNVITHDELIQKEFNTPHKGFYILKPNPIHIINHTPRHTQILFEADISFILYFLNISTQMQILESGTGSGTLTNLISNKITNGKLYSYERNLERYEALKVQFENRSNVDLINSDVNLAVHDEESLDGIFLDVPEPSVFIDKAYRFLKKGRKICVFVPTAEQVITARDAMSGRFEMRMFENVKRKFNTVKKDEDLFVCKKPQYSHTGFLIFGIKF